jgi:hypothetical protein
MRNELRVAASLVFLGLASSVFANILVEMSFEEKMKASDVVLVGTVTGATPGRDEEYDATATVTTLVTLKGTPQAQHVVLTQSRISEDNPQCCQVGATYVMFLGRSADGSGLRSVNGRHGMIRIGPAQGDPKIEVIEPARKRGK